MKALKPALLIDQEAIVRDGDYDLWPGVIRNLYLLGNEGFKLNLLAPENSGERFSNILSLLQNEGITFHNTLLREELPMKMPHDKFVIILSDLGVLRKAELTNQRIILIGSNPEARSEGDKLERVKDWDAVADHLRGKRSARVIRETKETNIKIKINLDGSGKSEISTGLGFFDHMLEQISKHGKLDLKIGVEGDLQVDEHHTIEDTGIALGEAVLKALGDKRGVERYGFCLPMDDCLAQVAIDFGGRNWIVWEADFKREKVGDMPTEMFFHFFKSFSDSAKCNLNIKAEGQNEHHKIEAIFKAFARAIKMAKKQDRTDKTLPSTKGTL